MGTARNSLGITGIAALALSAGLATATNPPASLVSFQWTASGSANPTAGANCASGCANTSGCNTTGAPYSAGGATLVQQFNQYQARESCAGVCGGAAIASSVGQTDAVINISDPFFNGDSLTWHWSDSIGAQADAGTGQLCGDGIATGQAGGSASWDVVFDAVGGGGSDPGATLTLLTLGYQHQVGGNDPATGGSAVSSWSLEHLGGPTLFSDSIQMGFDGTVTHNGAPAFSLTAGRYHLHITKSCAATFSSFAGSPSGGRGSNTSSIWNLRFDPYVCASVSADPQSARSCAGAPVNFSTFTTGSAPVYQWEWRRAGTTAWTPIANGVNMSGGTPVFTASGQGTALVSLTPITSTRRELRVTISNACASASSGVATFAASSADFNGDGDIGTDQDIEAFFACLAGNCCAACGSADFNGDGDVGTDQDIETFFRVLAGGNC